MNHLERTNKVETTNPRILNLSKSTYDERDYSLNSEKVKSLLASQPVLNSETSTKYLDMIPLLSPVRDQGSETNCVGHVMSVVKEYHELIDTRRSGEQKQIIFSPNFVYDKRENTSSGGMTYRNAFSIMKQHGALPDSMY